jgi:hypothetical protein
MATLSRRIPRPPRPAALTAPRADPVIAQYTREILELHASGGRHDVRVKADIGGILFQARERLAHGDFGRWLEAELPYSTRTAQRAINLYHVRNSNPSLFETIAPLGVAKVYVLLTLPPAGIKSLVGKRHRVPGVATSMTLAQLSFGQFVQLIAARKQSPPDASTTIVRNYTHQVHKLIRTIDTMIEHRPSIDDHAIHDLHDDLLHAAARLAHAFHLDDD